MYWRVANVPIFAKKTGYELEYPRFYLEISIDTPLPNSRLRVPPPPSLLRGTFGILEQFRLVVTYGNLQNSIFWWDCRCPINDPHLNLASYCISLRGCIHDCACQAMTAFISGLAVCLFHKNLPDEIQVLAMKLGILLSNKNNSL